jgi:hypothetical protein
MNMGKNLWRIFRTERLLREHGGFVALITWLGGFTLGAVTNIYPKPLGLIGGAITLLSILLLVIRVIRSEKRSDLSGWDDFVREPDEDAVNLVGHANEHFLVVGQAIEILPHLALNTRADVNNIGWDPEEVVFNDTQQKFADKEILEKVGGYKEADPPNGVKFCLSDTSIAILDSPDLVLDLQRTDYFTLMSILPSIKQNSKLRMKFGSLSPPLNQIPHSLCLHFVVRFSDGNILCMRRRPKAAYHKNLWSFSGEEQLSDSDFIFKTTGLSLFQRTLCEEVLALRDKSPATLAERWAIASPLVKNMRLWSIFLEEQIFNFSVFGFYQLEYDTQEFVSFHNDLINRGIGTRDKEGDYFVASSKMVENLLFKNQCVVQGLFTPESQTLSAETLHPTSRYRIFRLLRAIHRKPLEPQTI